MGEFYSRKERTRVMLTHEVSPKMLSLKFSTSAGNWREGSLRVANGLRPSFAPHSTSLTPVDPAARGSLEGQVTAKVKVVVAQRKDPNKASVPQESWDLTRFIVALNANYCHSSLFEVQAFQYVEF